MCLKWSTWLQIDWSRKVPLSLRSISCPYYWILTRNIRLRMSFSFTYTTTRFARRWRRFVKGCFDRYHIPWRWARFGGWGTSSTHPSVSTAHQVSTPIAVGDGRTTGGMERTVAVGHAGQIGKIYLACLVITRYINDPNKESRINLVFLCGCMPRHNQLARGWPFFERRADLPFAKNRS